MARFARLAEQVARIDAAVFRYINHTRLRSKGFDRFMYTFTQLGEGWFVLVPLTAVNYLTNLSGPWYPQALSILLAAGVICQVIKRCYPKTRPAGQLDSIHVVGRRLTAGSFPSGHTATSFGLAVILSHHAPAYSPLFFLAAFLIGWTRMYIGAHFPFDVLFGCIIGLISSFGVLTWFELSPALGVANPLKAVFFATLATALALPLFGKYSFSDMVANFNGEARHILMVIRKWFQ